MTNETFNPVHPGTEISLALQGGGSHGALAWGVIDRLLKEEGLSIVGISGTSAGAMNGAVLASALGAGRDDTNSRARARDALAAFWRAVSDAGALSPIKRTPLARATGSWSLDDSPAYLWLDMMSRVFSPYQTGNASYRALKRILSSIVDFDILNGPESPRLFVTATNVRTGLPRVFTQPNLTVESLIASAALPTLFPAVEIDGEAYWDGGYVGNPALYPLVRQPQGGDLVIVQTNPFGRDEVPKTARDIHNRLNEITFNSALLKELRAIQLALEKGGILPDVRLHRVYADEALASYTPSSKLNVEWAYLQHLFARGGEQANLFLAENRAALGVRATFDPAPMAEAILDHPHEGAR